MADLADAPNDGSLLVARLTNWAEHHPKVSGVAPASPIATQETADIPGLVEFVAGTLPSGATVSGQSWGGFNVYGDEKSMKEFRRIFHAEDRALSLQRVILAEREALSSAERRNEELVRERAHWLGIAQQKLADLQDLAPRYEALRTENYDLKAALASLAGQVGEMREKVAKVADDIAEGVASGLLRADPILFEMIADSIRALAPSPPGISTTGGDGHHPQSQNDRR